MIEMKAALGLDEKMPEEPFKSVFVNSNIQIIHHSQREDLKEYPGFASVLTF